MFSDVVGHSKIVSMLQNAIKLGRVGGSYIFHGPEGVGKEFVALQFAKTLNCLNFNTTNYDYDSCETCRSCKKINDGNHPDVRTTKPDTAWLRIDQIRALQVAISYKPMEGRKKIFIVAQAERMNLEAANCLLKTLEEPPADSLLILLTTSYSSLLETVRSRCRSFKFYPLPMSLIAEHLVKKLSLSEKDAKSSAALSEGSLEKALQVAENLEFVTEEDIPDIIKGINSLKIFRFAEELGNRPEKLHRLLSWYRDLLLVKQGCPVENLSLMHTDRYQELVEISKKYSIREICDSIKGIMETERLLKRNINTALAMEVLTFKLNKIL